MAAGISSGSQYQEVVALARRRVWQVLLPAVLTGSLGVMVGSLMPAKYKAKTILELTAVTPTLEQAGLDRNELSDRVQAAQKTLEVNDRLDKVLSRLEWEHYQTLPPDERRVFIKRVAKNLEIEAVSVNNTNLMFLEFTYEDTDPQRAAQFANELREYFVDDLIDNVRQKAELLLERYQDELKQAGEAYDDAQRTLQDLRKDNSISPTQSVSSEATDREQDPVFAELQAEETERTRVSKALQVDLRQREELKLRLEGLPLKVKQSETKISGVDLNEQVEDLLLKIETARALQEGKKPAHSDHQNAQRQIAEYERRLELLQSRSVSATQIDNEIPNPARKDVEDQIATLDLDIKAHRSLLESINANIERLEPKVAERFQVYSDLTREFERFKRATVSVNRLSVQKEDQSRLVDSLALPDFSPFDVTEVALPPTRPSSPSALIVVAAGVILGLALGVLFALLAEFGRNAYRSPAELARALPSPVLGVVNRIVTLREQRSEAFRSGLVGASTLILAGGILWVTWAFHSRPSLLGPELTGWLDDVRGQFR